MAIFGKIERTIAIALLALMGIVVISGVLEVAYVAIAALVIALSGGYYFIKKTNIPRPGL
jgi:hypothetical protein